MNAWRLAERVADAKCSFGIYLCRHSLLSGTRIVLFGVLPLNVCIAQRSGRSVAGRCAGARTLTGVSAGFADNYNSLFEVGAVRQTFE